MFTIRLVIGLASLGIVAWLAYDFLTVYLSTSGSRMSRALIAFKGSVTIAWQRFVMAIAFAVNGIAQLADYFNLPGVGDALRAYMTPSTMLLVIAGVTIISEYSRKRTL